MELVYKDTPWGDITIKDTWPEWQQRMWLDYLKGYKPVNSFLPTFEEQHYSRLPDAPPLPLNPDYYATEDTAVEVMRMFDAASIGLYHPANSDGTERWLVFTDGTALNAGQLAAQFSRNPYDVAVLNCKRGIAEARSGGQKLPAVEAQP